MARNWKKILEAIRPGLSEADLEILFVQPLLEEIGFDPLSYKKDRLFKSGSTTAAPDYTCWQSQDSPDPILVVEAKAVTEGSGWTNKAVPQVEREMRVSKARFGLVANGLQIQLFQRHGKICVPRTRLQDVTVDTILGIIKTVKANLAKPRRALTVMFWNNKGGVGKTTITGNIGAALAKRKEVKVLLVNFDLQGDLNLMFDFPSAFSYRGPFTMYEALDDVVTGLGQIDYRKLARNKKFDVGGSGVVGTGLFASVSTYSLDIIPGDMSMKQVEKKSEQGTDIQEESLKLLLEACFYDEYDYILIDAAPTWQNIARPAAIAADAMVPIIDNSNFAVNALERLIADYFNDILNGDDSFLVPKIPGYIINSRFQTKGTVESSIERMQEKVEERTGLKPTSWIVPNYAEIERATESGKPVVYSRPNGAAAKQFIKLADLIF